ncbi:MAG: chemotaxis protein CheW [bacterium]
MEETSPNVEAISFEIDGMEFGVDILRVQEIIRWIEPTRILDNPHIEGTIDLRGEIIPIIDVRKKLGLPGLPPSNSTRVIIVEVEDGKVGLVVDGMREAVRLSKEALEDPHPLVENNGREIVQAIARKDDRLIIILNVDALVSDETDAPHSQTGEGSPNSALQMRGEDIFGLIDHMDEQRGTEEVAESLPRPGFDGPEDKEAKSGGEIPHEKERLSVNGHPTTGGVAEKVSIERMRALGGERIQPIYIPKRVEEIQRRKRGQSILSLVAVALLAIGVALSILLYPRGSAKMSSTGEAAEFIPRDFDDARPEGTGGRESFSVRLEGDSGDRVTINYRAEPSKSKTEGPLEGTDRSVEITIEGKAQGEPPSREEFVHIVARGDTLWHIARRYLGAPLKYHDIADYNRILNPDLIYPGDRINIVRVRE